MGILLEKFIKGKHLMLQMVMQSQFGKCHEKLVSNPGICKIYAWKQLPLIPFLAVMALLPGCSSEEMMCNCVPNSTGVTISSLMGCDSSLLDSVSIVVNAERDTFVVDPFEKLSCKRSFALYARGDIASVDIVKSSSTVASYKTAYSVLGSGSGCCGGTSEFLAIQIPNGSDTVQGLVISTSAK